MLASISNNPELKQDIEQVRSYLVRIQEQLWELENKGQLDDDNISAIVSHLASAHYYARKAKWRGVEHLKVEKSEDADLMS
jgi:hypothetical protein